MILSSILSFSIFAGSGALAIPNTEIEHVSDAKVAELEQLFSIGAPAEKSRIQKLHQSLWSCDLFGVKSRMQVIRDAKLYSFLVEGSSIKNLGSQEVKSYSILAGELTGSSARISDQVRFLSRNHLISKITTKSETPEALAFAICKSM